MLNNFQNEKTLQQIDQLSKYLRLDPFVIEKDLYVTQAISVVSKISQEYYDLVFQGGTSLVKAHRIIERMSEDCDFRIRFKNSDKKISNEFKRKMLREFRHELVDALRNNGFGIDDANIRVRNEGQFMAIRANYPSVFSQVEILKPFIALDFFLAEVKLMPEMKSVTTLIRQVFGEKINHPEFSVNSVAIIETAAEKWVGLTRRVATSVHRKHYRDSNLVRHLYDLYKIKQKGYFTDEFFTLISRIVHDDRENYKNHNDDYYQNPTSEIKRAVDELSTSFQWRDDWDNFVDTMVFENEKPTYDSVLHNLHKITETAMLELQTVFH